VFRGGFGYATQDRQGSASLPDRHGRRPATGEEDAEDAEGAHLLTWRGCRPAFASRTPRSSSTPSAPSAAPPTRAVGPNHSGTGVWPVPKTALLPLNRAVLAVVVTVAVAKTPVFLVFRGGCVYGTQDGCPRGYGGECSHTSPQSPGSWPSPLLLL